MRLIDADALPIWSYPQEWEEGQGIKKCCDAVENAPTVEAIPISWIKSYVLSTGKAILPFNAMINEWRRINGQ